MSYRIVGKAAMTVALALPAISSLAQAPIGLFNQANTSPTSPNPMRLLQHPEVQVEIGLTLMQRKKIADIREKQFIQMQERMRQTVQQTAQQARTANPQDRQAQFQEMQAAMQQQVESFQGELTKEIEEILKPEQVKRLRELDIQYRGPMALADQRVANEVKLSPDTRGKVGPMVSDFIQKSNELRRQYIQDWAASGGPRSGRAPDLTSRASPVRRKVDPMKKETEKAILDLLSDDELKAWNAIQGAKFTFRDDPSPPMPRYRQQ